MDELITAPELATRLDEVSVLDVRYHREGPTGWEDFLRGHIPGAAFVDLDADLAAAPAAGRHPLPDPEQFAAAMRRCGVCAGRPVVVLDDAANTFAARCWWLLRHHGHDQVLLLDGGWEAWLASGGPVETGEPAVGQGDFRATPGRLPVLDATGAARVAREGVLVDARAPERYRGEVEPLDPVAGHIPGAVNVPTSDNLDGGTFRPAAQLRVRYALAGVTDDTEVGVYCGSGVTAAHDVFALQLLGIRAALYVGSWSEWVSDRSRPVAVGERAGGEGADARTAG
ncbi:sulfurtransferase [Oryzihumus sp.]|uniref:sulfurtransferase n=1 Tax=Oryzihumus sp. TaxID=1968903 RepID=UPI002EDBB2ED